MNRRHVTKVYDMNENQRLVRLFVRLDELKDLEAAMYLRVEETERERRMFGDEYYVERARRNVALKNKIVSMVVLTEKKNRGEARRW